MRISKNIKKNVFLNWTDDRIAGYFIHLNRNKTK
jgi:hypothetical protein